MSFSMGWYKFDESKRIRKNKLYTVNRFGKPFVCFRDSNGSVHVYDAFCPHLGAHLGVGGKIEKDKIVCPFHGWKFNVSGECVEIPYCKSIPKRALLKNYPVTEVDQCTYIYYSDDLRIPEESLPKLLQDRHLEFKLVHSFQVESKHISKLSEAANALEIPLIPDGPGFFINDESRTSSFRVLVSATPLDDKFVAVSLSYSFPRGIPAFRTLNQRRAAKKQVLKMFQVLL